MAGRPRSPDASSRSRVAQVGNLRWTSWKPASRIRPPIDPRAFTRLGAARAPSPDVRSAHPGLRSLDAACAPASMPALVSNAGSRGTGSPSLSSRSTGFQPVCFPVLCAFPVRIGDWRRESRPAVRPRANHAGRGVWCGFAPRLTALGLYHQPRKAHDEPVSQVPPAPSMSPAGCGAATTREHQA